MSNLIERLETLWCRHMHDATMWPIHGHYRCGTCHREYPVAFEARTEPRVSASGPLAWSHSKSAC